MRPRQVERRTHDCRRHGTATLFAALNVKTSEPITQFHQRHLSIEFRQFLGAVDAAVPRHLEVHLIMDNYGTRRGVHRSVTQLKAAIREFIDAHHAHQKPFVWTKTADQILESIARWLRNEEGRQSSLRYTPACPR